MIITQFISTYDVSFAWNLSQKEFSMLKNRSRFLIGLGLTILITLLTGCHYFVPEPEPEPNFYPIPKVNVNSTDYSLNGSYPSLYDGIQRVQIGNNITYYIPSDTFFVANSGVIYRGNYLALKALAADLSPYYNAPKTVTAYTDNVRSQPQNVRIAQEQAQNLIAFLWLRGINHFYLQPVAIGEQYPIANNFELRGSRFNRHIEITVRIPSNVTAYSKQGTAYYTPY